MNRCKRWVALALLVVFTLGSVVSEAAKPVPTIWSYLPDKPLIIVKLQEPQRLTEQIIRYAQWPEIQGLAAFREFQASTPWKRFQQFVAYIEKELGTTWPELLKQYSHEGVVFSLEAKIGQPKADEAGAPPEAPRALLILPLKNAGQAQQVTQMIQELGQFELARQDSKAKYQTTKHRDVSIVHLGDQFAFASTGHYLILANQPQVLKDALDRKESMRKEPPAYLAAVEKKANGTGQRIAWAWVDLMQIKQDQNIHKLLEIPNNDPIPYYVLGGLLDAVRQSSWALAELCSANDDLMLQITLPGGRKNMNPALRAAFTPDPQGPGLQPYIELPGTFYQQSFYFDINALLAHQADYLSESVRKEFQEFDKKSGFVLYGHRFSKIVSYLGGRHQFLVTQQRDTGYDVKPKTMLPAFGLLLELRDPDAFDRAMQPILRSVGLLGSLNVKMKMMEEDVGNVHMIGYRMVDNEDNRSRDQGLLFNFSPCFARVGRFYMLASTQEMGRDLIQHLTHAPMQNVTNDGTSIRHHFSWPALGLYFDSIKSAIVTQTILQEGGSRSEAEKQFTLLKELLERLGTIELSVQYLEDQFRMELRTRVKQP